MAQTNPVAPATRAHAAPVVDPKVRKKANEILSAARYIARSKVPYFSPILLKLVMREAPGLGTIATSAEGICRYDPAFLVQVTPKQAAGLLIHECLHVMLKHFERTGGRDPKEFNIAADRAINPGIIQCGLELPQGKLAGCFPKDIGMKDGLTADEYYKAPEDGDQGQPQPGCGQGGCGGCAGNPRPEEAGDAGDPGARSSAELSRAAKETAEAMKDAAAKQAGNVPGDWARMVGSLLQPPRVPWQKRLAQITRAAVAFRPGAIVTKYDAPSRRQAGIGYGNNKPILPRFRAPVPHVAVAIDTSGSMGEAELTEAAVETRGILKAVGADITFLACDTEVHKQGKARRVEDVIKGLKGGGGTDFRPVFAALEKARPRPEVVVFVTDGFGPAPATQPAWCRTIWLLVGPSTTRPAPWGDVIDLSEDS